MVEVAWSVHPGRDSGDPGTVKYGAKGLMKPSLASVKSPYTEP